MEIEISKIVVKGRIRKDFGDIEGLAISIKEVGLLQPLVIDQDNTLVAGERRLKAVISLGWTAVPARQLFLNGETFLQAEADENEIRKDFTVSEKYDIALARAHQLRGRWGGDRKQDQGGQLPTLNTEVGKTRDIAAKEAGLGSGRNFRRVGEIITNGIPELVEALDAGNIKTHPAAIISKLPEEQQLEELKNKLNPPAKEKEKPVIVCDPDPTRMFQEGMPFSAEIMAHRAIIAIEQIYPKDPKSFIAIDRIQAALNKQLAFVKEKQ